MEQMKVGGVVKDYVKIAYQGSDALYVPATQPRPCQQVYRLRR